MEIIPTTIQAALDTAKGNRNELIIMQVGLSNGYDLLKRGRVYNKLRKMAIHPSLLSYFKANVWGGAVVVLWAGRTTSGTNHYGDN